jgi:formate hydrogenlyase subunit 3/multisubunit Na+/H+ antiporter MnhD subunit
VTSTQALAVAVVAAPLVTAGLLALVPRRRHVAVAYIGAGLTSLLTLILAGLAAGDAAHPITGQWIVIDAAGALLLAVIAIVGLSSVLASPSYLRGAHGSFLSAERRERD